MQSLQFPRKELNTPVFPNNHVTVRCGFTLLPYFAVRSAFLITQKQWNAPQLGHRGSGRRQNVLHGQADSSESKARIFSNHHSHTTGPQQLKVAESRRTKPTATFKSQRTQDVHHTLARGDACFRSPSVQQLLILKQYQLYACEPLSTLFFFLLFLIVIRG